MLLAISIGQNVEHTSVDKNLDFLPRGALESLHPRWPDKGRCLREVT